MRRIDTCGASDTSDSSYNIEGQLVLHFMNKKSNRYLEVVHDLFIKDLFNLYGLKEKVEGFSEAYRTIQGNSKSKTSENENELYLLMHQRFIYTKMGAQNISERVLNKEYGTCPRYGCKKTCLIPCGLSSEYLRSKTHVYCYTCGNIFEPRGSLKKLDGCAWGKGFPHFLMLAFPMKFERKKVLNYEGKLFGFKLCDKEGLK